MGTNGSRRLICAVGAGLLLLGGLVFWVVWRLEAQVMEEALRSQVESFESHWQGVVDRYATAAFSSADGDLDSFGQKLMTAAESNPAILDVFVVTPGGEVVHQYSRQGRKTLDCLAKVPREVYVNHEHPGRIGCLNLPIKFGGTHRGSVLVHTLRDWFDEGRRAGRTVKRTAIRLAPIFLAFYVLLGGMLVVAGRTTRRWRMRAASAERRPTVA